jgi:hypothetical protein
LAQRAATNEQAFAEAEESMLRYPKRGARIISEVADDSQKFQKDLGTYHYTEDAKKLVESGAIDEISMNHIKESCAAMVGGPDRCIEIAKRYEAAGCDLLFCRLNPYNMTHEQVMSSIEQLGNHVIP